MSQSLLLFFISVGLVLGLSLSRRVDVSIALVTATAFFGATALWDRAPQVTLSAFDETMAYVLLSLVPAMALGNLMRLSRERIASGLSALGPRAAALGIPAAMGLLPMPGGAYVSAVLADPVYRSMGLGSEEKSFINYWMRHVWLPTWPLFQGVLIAAAVLHVPVFDVVGRSWVASLAAFAAGVTVAWPSLRPVGRSGRWRDLASLWPLALVTALSAAVPLPVAAAASLVAFVAVKRPPIGDVAAAFKYALSPRILTVLVASLVFSRFIEEADVSGELASALGPATALAAFLLPLVITVGTGVEYTYAALAFPPLAPLLHGPLLAVAFAGGFIGVMLSPAHLCMVLTADYYGADTRRLYRPVLKASIITAALTWALAFTALPLLEGA